MRVITRHSKLLYFRKHLPSRQFLGLCGIVALEAAIRRAQARLMGRAEDCRAWRTVAEITGRLQAGADLRGRDVLRMAEAIEVDEPDRLPVRNGPHQGRERARAGDHPDRIPVERAAAGDDRSA
jgi:hypothetical protein